MTQLMSHHVRRQFVNDPNDDGYCSYWTCDETAWIIKWVIIGAVVIFFFGFVLIGYWHARRRMARGQAPLRYHRWLISRSARERFFPPQRPTQNPYVYYRTGGGAAHPQQGYRMDNYGYGHPAPPPAYHEAEYVPAYTPPSKVNPDQAYNGAPTGPQSPPPALVELGLNSQTGSSHQDHMAGPSHPSRVTSPFRSSSRADK